MRVIITGGGTGGHLFPGIALATGLQERIADCEIMFIGTRRQLDQDTLADYNFQRKSISCMGIKGKGLSHRLKSMASLPGAVFEAGRIIRSFKPDLVCGVGGYVTGPVLLAAKLQAIPTCIHEQNSVPGLANRMISRFVDRIFISIPGPTFPVKKTVFSGNPVRSDILAAATEKERINKNRKTNRDKNTILVLGGSLGAHQINLFMLEAMADIARQVNLNLIHQTGSADEELVCNGYTAAGITCEVSAFFKDMANLYAQADLVIARAGATTLAELSVMGIPALLIPYPYAADDHQAKNAAHYVQSGGAIMYRESELDASLLATTIIKLLQAPDELQQMANSMKKMGRPDATDIILDNCLTLTH